MKKIVFSLSSFLCTSLLMAQTPDDILKYSYQPQHGTARSMAIGGAMGSLGGDLSALYVNPAGLGLYKTSEITLSPGFNFFNNKAEFRSTNTTSSKSAFDLGLTGAVFGIKSRYSRNSSEAFAVAVNQTANFNNTVTYRGNNTLSSYSEQFVEEISRSGYSLDEILNTSSPFPFGSAQALYTYLVDTATIGGTTVIKGAPEYILDNGGTLTQQKTTRSTGGIYEIALGYAANTNERFYYGITLGVPLVSYTRNTMIREEDATGDDANGFGYSEWNNKLNTTGVGLNAKLGLMFKPADFVRLGFAIHTPTYYSLTDDESSSMTTNVDDNTFSTNSAQFTDGGIGSTNYITSTPWKFIASGSYVIRETSDVTRQRGFITADAEYVTYSSAKYKSQADLQYSGGDDYYSAVNAVINDYYKGAFNFRLGGELKFNTVMVRLGGAYYGNPYRDEALSSSLVQLSGGLGYRNRGMFIDLTYAHIINKDVNFPYRLQDKANTFANYNNTRGNLMLTLGFKI